MASDKYRFISNWYGLYCGFCDLSDWKSFSMNIADVIVLCFLGICLVLAIRGSSRKCHDCTHCHKICGGKKNGEEFRKFIEDQRNRIN